MDRLMLGPLFGKELLEMARRRRYFVLRAVIGATLLAGWWAALGGQTPTVAYKNLGSLSAVGDHLYRAWATWTLWGVVALGPMLVSGVIAAEKDGRTFEILLTTLLTNREILVGKAASRVLLILILLASSVPILAVASLYGGFDVGQVAASTAVIAATASFVAVVSLYYSAVTFKPYIALLRTYFLLVVLWWLLPAATAAFDLWPVRSPWQIMNIATGDQAFYGGQTVQWRYAGRVYRPAKGTMLATIANANTRYLIVAGGVHLVLAAVLFWRTSTVMRRCLQPGKPPWLFVLAVRLYNVLVNRARRAVERRKRSAGWSSLWSAEEASERWWRRGLERALERNPLLYRNRVANAFDPERFVATIQLLVGLGALFAFLYLAWKERGGAIVDAQFERLGIWALLGAEVLFLVCSAILSASSFARERQYGSWEILALTDLPPRMHLTGAIAGVAGTLRLLLIVLLALALVVGYVFSGFVPMAVWLFSTAALWLLIVVYSLWTSLFHRSIAGALAAVVFGLAVVLIGSSLAAYGQLGPPRLIAAGLAVCCVFTCVAWWLANHADVPWSLVHLGGTLALTLFVAAACANEVESPYRAPTLHVGDYLVVERTTAVSLMAFPLTWGRRFAYGLTESIPNPRAAGALVLATAVTAAAFLTMFRSLTAAESAETRGRKTRAGPRQSPAQCVG